MAGRVLVRVPATTANIGPGFDSLSLSLDLWNEAEFTAGSGGFRVVISGEGVGRIPNDENNLVIRAARFFYERRKLTFPASLQVHCRNHVPLSSGMGSSAAATLLGLLGANALSGANAAPAELLDLAAEIEGHADNAAAALYGGLLLAAPRAGGGFITHRMELPRLDVCIVLPEFDLSTRAARAALPLQVSMRDAVFNLSHTALVVEALRTGHLDLLAQAMHDKLHQPYRLAIIPGGFDAVQAARDAGAVAVGLSGAGPSILAFVRDTHSAGRVSAAIQAAFAAVGLHSRAFLLETTPRGSEVTVE